MRTLYKIHDNPGLHRDPDTSAILTTDKNALQKYKTNRDFQIKRIKEQVNLAARQDKLEADINEIKDLLKILVTKAI